MPVYADDEGTPACATVLIDRRLLSGFMHSRETAERLGHAPTGNGQADSTTEFMFGITLAYEISDGKIGHAVRDTTVSGSAIKVLQSVDAVSDDMHWDATGYCGKKQMMVVAMGGPALRARIWVVSNGFGNDRGGNRPCRTHHKMPSPKADIASLRPTGATTPGAWPKATRTEPALPSC